MSGKLTLLKQIGLLYIMAQVRPSTSDIGTIDHSIFADVESRWVAMFQQNMLVFELLLRYSLDSVTMILSKLVVSCFFLFPY